MPDTRLIERWLPIAALGVESKRERTPMTPFPAPNRLHVWWARRPLVAARAAVLALAPTRRRGPRDSSCRQSEFTEIQSERDGSSMPPSEVRKTLGPTPTATNGRSPTPRAPEDKEWAQKANGRSLETINSARPHGRRRKHSVGSGARRILGNRERFEPGGRAHSQSHGGMAGTTRNQGSGCISRSSTRICAKG